MFVHWGLYFQPGVGEWTCHSHHRDMNEYKKLKGTFTAEDFDAEAPTWQSREKEIRTSPSAG